MINSPRLLSARTISEMIDISLSQFYADVKSGRFPEPEVKLWGDSRRGYRWEESTIALFIIRNRVSPRIEEEDDKPFVPIDAERIIRQGRKVA